MSIIESIKDKKNDIVFFLCYNCDTRINDLSMKRCPTCHIILHPNSYIKWARSWYGFLCLLCLIPILIAIFISLF